MRWFMKYNNLEYACYAIAAEQHLETKVYLTWSSSIETKWIGDEN